MALPRPQEERWRYDSAAVALLLLQTLVPCCPPRHVPRTPLCLGRDTSPWTAQHKFPPSAAALQRMAGRFTRCWRGLANGTVPGVD
jgi:hypothetical protein